MNLLVQPSKGFNIPSVETEVSIARMEVVPTAQTLLLFSFALAVPDELVTKENIKSVRLLPLIFLMMVMNFFRIKGANKHFIHTQKGINGK